MKQPRRHSSLSTVTAFGPSTNSKSPARCARLVQSLVTPVITTSLYFVVFGAAIGSRLTTTGGVSYGAFIVPGLIMLALFTESLSNASFGIYFPKFTGTIYELLSAPVSYVEIVIAYVGAAASKSVVLGLDHSGDGIAVRADQDPASRLDDRLPVDDGGHLQLVWIHHRHLGQGIRAAAIHSDAGHHAADVLGRRILFHRHAAAGVAHVQPLQSHRVLDQRLSLELLRRGRCQRRHQLR